MAVIQRGRRREIHREIRVVAPCRAPAGASLFEVAGSIDRDRAGRQLACFLAALHQPATLERARAAVGTLTGAQPPPATTMVGIQMRLRW